MDDETEWAESCVVAYSPLAYQNYRYHVLLLRRGSSSCLSIDSIDHNQADLLLHFLTPH